MLIGATYSGNILKPHAVKYNHSLFDFHIS